MPINKSICRLSILSQHVLGFILLFCILSYSSVFCDMSVNNFHLSTFNECWSCFQLLNVFMVLMVSYKFVWFDSCHSLLIVFASLFFALPSIVFYHSKSLAFDLLFRFVSNSLLCCFSHYVYYERFKICFSNKESVSFKITVSTQSRVIFLWTISVKFIMLIFNCMPAYVSLSI